MKVDDKITRAKAEGPIFDTSSNLDINQSKTKKDDEFAFARAIRQTQAGGRVRAEGFSTSCQLPSSSNDDLEQVLRRSMRETSTRPRRRTTIRPKRVEGSGNIDGRGWGRVKQGGQVHHDPQTSIYHIILILRWYTSTPSAVGIGGRFLYESNPP